MAFIKFENEAAHERFVRCRSMSYNQEHSLDRAIMSLANWHPWNATITIGCDFHPDSFWFVETDEEGRRGINGGIIFHGSHDNGGDGDGPTFSVNLSPTDGYLVHT